MTALRPGGSALAGLRRIISERPAPVVGERCEMCAEPITDEHPHVVDLESRALMCTCRGCYLLFTAEDAQLRYRAVPDRYLSFPDVTLDARQYDELEIPVGLAFLFNSSVLNRTVAFYPGPAGATESELPLEAWTRVVEANPSYRCCAPMSKRCCSGGLTGAASSPATWSQSMRVTPWSGQLRRLWRGFDGGTEAHQAMDDFFAEIAARSRPAPPITEGDVR